MSFYTRKMPAIRQCRSIGHADLGALGKKMPGMGGCLLCNTAIALAHPQHTGLFPAILEMI